MGAVNFVVHHNYSQKMYFFFSLYIAICAAILISISNLYGKKREHNLVKVSPSAREANSKHTMQLDL